MSHNYKYCTSFTFEGKRYHFKADNKKELAEKVARRKIELEEGSKRLKPSQLNVRKWATECFEMYKGGLAPITYQSQWERCNKWILSSIGSMRVKDVKPLHCQKILNDMEGKATDTVRKVSQLLKWIFDKAIQNDIIKDNPAEYIDLPKTKKATKRRVITDQERHYLLQVADKDDRFVFFLVMLYCGLRPSEVAGLKGKDIQSLADHNILHVEGTKTVNAVRDVPIPDDLMKRLPAKSKFEYLFTNKRGEKLSKSSRAKLWTACKRAMNIAMGCKVYRNEIIPPYRVAEDLVPYCLRHTYCTDFLNMGIDIRVVQYLMGHSNITVTDGYTHINNKTAVLHVSEAMRKASDNIEKDVAITG